MRFLFLLFIFSAHAFALDSQESNALKSLEGFYLKDSASPCRDLPNQVYLNLENNRFVVRMNPKDIMTQMEGAKLTAWYDDIDLTYLNKGPQRSKTYDQFGFRWIRTTETTLKIRNNAIELLDKLSNKTYFQSPVQMVTFLKLDQNQLTYAHYENVPKNSECYGAYKRANP